MATCFAARKRPQGQYRTDAAFGGRPAQIRIQTSVAISTWRQQPISREAANADGPIAAGADPGKALDPDAAFDERYSYRISRVTTVSIGGKSIDIAGPSSAEILVNTKDIFPPSAPTGLAAVAAPDEGAIDLSWAPNTETDLAGYAVYRSELGGEPVRISPPGKPIDSPAFRDATARPGHEYTYTVTAIDRDGNESVRSAEVKETLPPKP